MVKFTLQLLLISLMTLLASSFIAFHVGLAIYLFIRKHNRIIKL